MDALELERVAVDLLGEGDHVGADAEDLPDAAQALVELGAALLVPGVGLAVGDDDHGDRPTQLLLVDQAHEGQVGGDGGMGEGGVALGQRGLGTQQLALVVDLDQVLDDAHGHGHRRAAADVGAAGVLIVDDPGEHEPGIVGAQRALAGGRDVGIGDGLGRVEGGVERGADRLLAADHAQAVDRLGRGLADAVVVTLLVLEVQVVA
ncbi:MAG: hypothetical protein KC457_12930, partial [Myxococcales bacterium]|nr:hypothetical protein [Myxococcales bacterium]